MQCEKFIKIKNASHEWIITLQKFYSIINYKLNKLFSFCRKQNIIEILLYLELHDYTKLTEKLRLIKGNRNFNCIRKVT